jgi:hypothetical protein
MVAISWMDWRTLLCLKGDPKDHPANFALIWLYGVRE